MAQDRDFELKHPSTHTYPDRFPAQHIISNGDGVMPSKWVSSAAETLAESHDRNFRFCPAKSQLYRNSAKLSQDNLGIARLVLLADCA
jgi:hypothetical protein